MAKEGVDVLIYHPRLAQIGLDLIDFRQSFGLRPSSLSAKGVVQSPQARTLHTIKYCTR